MENSNSNFPVLTPLQPQPTLQADTDERFSPEAVKAFQEDRDEFHDRFDHPLHHYNQPQDDWGGSSTIDELLNQHQVSIEGLTMTVLGGFTGEFARILRDLGAEVIFTDPKQEWVSQAQSDGFEAYASSAEAIPADLISRSDAFATFECYYPFQAPIEYSLYTALRLLTRPHGLFFAETSRTRQFRQESGAKHDSLDIFRLIDEYIKVESQHEETSGLRMYQYRQPEDKRFQSKLWAEVLSQLYNRGNSEATTVINDEVIDAITEEMSSDRHIVIGKIDLTRTIYRDQLDEMAEFVPYNKIKIGSREFELDFEW